MSTWEDRRAMFQRGKEVHEPGQPIQPRRTSITDKLSKTLSGESATGKSGSPVSSAAGSGMPSPTAERRRSSATSGSALANFTAHKRGSESYGDRRSSVEEMEAKGGGAFSGWYNSTFRGMQKPKEDVPKAATGEAKRGVME